MSFYINPVLHVTVEPINVGTVPGVLMNLRTGITNKEDQVTFVLLPEVFERLVENICRTFNHDVNVVLERIAEKDEDRAEADAERELRKAALNRDQP